MDRQGKVEFVKSFHEEVKASPLVVVAGYSGTGANTANQVRRMLDGSGLSYRVVKNTLARRALAGTGREGLSEFFTGMTLVAFSGDDPVGAAKALKAALKEAKTVEIRAGFFEGEVIEPKQVAAIADLPSREELLVMALRTMQEPARRILGVLQAPGRDLLYLLQNYSDKLSEGE